MYFIFLSFSSSSDDAIIVIIIIIIIIFIIFVIFIIIIMFFLLFPCGAKCSLFSFASLPQMMLPKTYSWPEKKLSITVLPDEP